MKKVISFSLVFFFFGVFAFSQNRGTGTQSNPFQLSENNRMENLFELNNRVGAHWYSFSVSSGRTYRIVWEDSDTNTNMGWIDIVVDASYQGGPSIFTGADSNNERSFTADRNGTVLVRVYPYNSVISQGRQLYRIGYAQVSSELGQFSNPIPLTINTRTAGNLTSSTPNHEQWYSFSVRSGNTYLVVCEEDNNPLNNRIWNERLLLGYQDGPSITTRGNKQFQNVFTANRNGTVLVRINTRTGSSDRFYITYIIPQTLGMESNPIPLTINTLTAGNITSSIPDLEIWYSFSVNSGQAYSIRWNDASSNFDTLRIMIDASYQGGPSIFNRADSNNERSFMADRNGTVLVRVYSYPSNSGLRIGRFEIGYASITTLPGTQSDPIPLSLSTMIQGSITSTTPDSTIWYSFNVNSGQAYTIRWSDFFSGFSQLGIMVDASYQGGPSIFTAAGGSYNRRSFTADRNGTVLVMVYPNPSSYMPNTGSFQIGYEEY